VVNVGNSVKEISRDKISSEMSLIDVAMEEGEIMLARIVDTLEDGYNVQFLNPTRNEDYFRFDKNISYIEKECVSGYYESNDVTVAGYAEEVGGLYSRLDEDDEEYSDEDDDCED